MIDQPANILVVDDEPDVKALFSLRFRKEVREGKLRFLFAENGLEALAQLAADPTIDLVLSDINMPEMDGLSLLKKIRETYPGVQVVMVTAYGDLENIRAAMNAGSFDFLNKPFSMGDLKVTISNALAHVHKLKVLDEAKAEKEKAQKSLVDNLKRMDRLKDEFLANTTHELHTPLNGMIGLGEALLGGVAGPLNEKARSDLDLMVTSGRRLRILVRDILDFAKLRNEEFQIYQVPCDLKEMVNLVFSLSRPLLNGDSVALIDDFPEELPLVSADENRLFQILHNLIGNAVKFTESGEVRVTAEQIGNRLQTWVADTGPGIPEEEASRIFSAFEQIDGASKDGKSGSGLGLAITKKLVTLHGGELVVESQVGKGSRFGFSLALASAEAESMEKAQRLTEPLGKPVKSRELPITQPTMIRSGTWSVLAVDDEPVNLQVLVNQLSLHGAQVDPVSSGKQALAHLSGSTRYDLVILDVMMPGMSGLEVCREIRKTHALSDLPVLMLTARDRPENVVAGLEAGANDYLAKPFDSAELLARVKSLATLRRAVRHALHQARQLGAERKQREQLEYLRQFNQDLSSTLELREVLQRFLDHINDFAPHDLAFFCLDINGAFEVIAERGMQPYEPSIREKLHMRCTRWSDILKVKTEPLTLQLNDDLEGFDEVVSKSLSGAWIGIPMVSRGKLMGTLFLLRRRASRFGDQEIQLAFTFSGQACLSIENARLFEQVRQLAMTDALTGLYNRRFFFMEGDLAVERASRFDTPLSLLLLDIDHFKRFNDEHSHAVGDQVLVKLAETIRRQCRQADIAGRYGGEEIAILMPQTGETAAGEVAERLRQTIANTPLITKEKAVLKVTVSIGVATLREDDIRLGKLLGRADRALYRAKDAGRNCVISSKPA